MALQAPGVKLTLGYSPCPNDTFIFYALVHGAVDTGGLGFKEVLLDVETLNGKALGAELDITKVSFHAYGFLRDRYCLLRSGGALGRGCGPLVVAKGDAGMDDLRGGTIAIPGRLTTAFLLLQLCEPALARNVIVMPFDRIMDAVKKGVADAGLIIHESRFTYPAYGLCEVMDLGRWWEEETGAPIPLGGILAKKSLGPERIVAVEALVRKSIEYAFAHREETREYIRDHSQEIDDAVITRHIDLYVNDYSLDLGDDGVRAVEELLRRAGERGIIPGGGRAAIC
ncbi:MAG: 1,4-dihydroxy-6-naphthoate synthase [Nitrospirae bacterium]|nr:1,4-dihydroxy-6-naphthoate synthase [Nitrospirota bacterium]